LFSSAFHHAGIPKSVSVFSSSLSFHRLVSDELKWITPLTKAYTSVIPSRQSLHSITHCWHCSWSIIRSGYWSVLLAFRAVDSHRYAMTRRVIISYAGGKASLNILKTNGTMTIQMYAVLA
jgi:hypothetical protein